MNAEATRLPGDGSVQLPVVTPIASPRHRCPPCGSRKTPPWYGALPGCNAAPAVSPWDHEKVPLEFVKIILTLFSRRIFRLPGSHSHLVRRWMHPGGMKLFFSLISAALPGRRECCGGCICREERCFCARPAGCWFGSGKGETMWLCAAGNVRSPG